MRKETVPAELGEAPEYNPSRRQSSRGDRRNRKPSRSGANGAKAIAATTTRVIITALATATNATPARTIRTTAGRKLRKAQTDQTVPKTAPRRPKAESKRPLRGHSRVMSFRRSHSMIQRKSASFTLHLETASLEHGCRTLVSS